MNKSKSNTNIPNIDYGNLMKLQYDGSWIAYKQLCECLNLPYLSGNSKIKQLRELASICEYKQEGNKYKIIKVRSNKDYEYTRYITNSKQFNVSVEDKNKAGIYSIILEDVIYIGQTNNFRRRYLKHLRGDNNLNYDTEKLLKDGGIFSIIELEEDLSKRLKLEKEYILKFIHDENYNCVNKKDSKVKYKVIKVKESNHKEAVNLLKKEKYL